MNSKTKAWSSAVPLVLLGAGMTVALGTTAQAATVTCTATTVRDADVALNGNHRGECYRVQAQARRYFGGGAYSTVNGPITTATSIVYRSPGISLDSHKVRAQPVDDSGNSWSTWYTPPVGTKTYFKFTAHT